MKKYFTLSLSYKGETLDDIPVERQGFTLSKLVGAKGKHAIQSCKIKCQDRNAVTFILKANDFVFAKIFNGEQCIHEGVIKPYLSISAAQTRIDTISLDILDYTELLDKQVFLDLSKFQDKINVEGAIIERRWKNQTVDTILRDLFGLAGIADLCTIVFEPSTYMKKSFVDFRIVDGDNLHEVIDNLCYESFVDYRFEPGVVHVYPTDVFTSDIPITDYRLRAKVSRGKDKFEGVSVSYQKPQTSSLRIYHEDNRFDDAWNTFAYHRDYSGYYYEHEMHNLPGAKKPTKFTAQWSFKDLESQAGKITVVSVSNASISSTLHDEKGVSISSHLDSYDETGGCAYVYYDGRFNDLFGKGWGFEYDVYGTVRFKRAFDVPVVAGLKPKKIDLKYIEDVNWAKQFGKIYQQRQQQNVDSYDFTSFQQLEPGRCYLFKEDAVLGVAATVRILSSSYNYDTKLYTYKAEGANALEVVDLVPSTDTGDIDTPAVPPELADFFYLTVNRNLFLLEETSEKATVVAHGFAIPKASQLDWILNGDYLDKHEASVDIPVTEMNMGRNTVTCRIIIDTEPYERTVDLIKTNTNDSAIIQYRWGENPLNPPITDGGLWFWNGKIIFLDKKVIGNLNDEAWITSIPGKSENKPYLWMRVSTDGGKTWSYTRLPGADDVTFRIIAEPSSYPWSVRGATVAQTKIKLRVEKQNTINDCSWASVPKLFEPVTGDTAEFIIPSGFQPKEIEIKATIEGVGTKSFMLPAYEIGSKTPVYVGDSFTLDQLEAMPQNPLGFPWAEGDNALIIKVVDGRENPVPYVYHENVDPHWTEAEKTDKNISQIMSSALYDIVDHGSMDMTNAAVYGFFEKLAAVYALIENLDVMNLRVFNTVLNNPDKGMFVHITTKGPEKLPLFIVKYDGKTIFQIAPNSGNIFFGEPDDQLVSPLSGFMYRASDGSLVSPKTIDEKGFERNVEIKTSGELVTSRATVRDAYFSGQFDCSSIFTDVSPLMEDIKITSTVNIWQARDFIRNYYPNMENGRRTESDFIRIKLDENTSVAYMKLKHTWRGQYHGEDEDWGISFYDFSLNRITLEKIGIPYSRPGDPITAIETTTNGPDGVYFTKAVEIKVISGGNILRLDIPIAPSKTDIDKMPFGQMYSLSDGTLRMSIKNK